MTRTNEKRKVTVATTSVSGGAIDIMTDAATFDHLKEDIAAAIPGTNLEKFKFVERATKNTFEQPDAMIPEGEFILFMTPKKDISSGASEESLRTYSTKALEAKLNSKSISKEEKKFVEGLLKERAAKSKGKVAPKPKEKVVIGKLATATRAKATEKEAKKEVNPTVKSDRLALEERIENLERAVYGKPTEIVKSPEVSKADLRRELQELER